MSKKLFCRAAPSRALFLLFAGFALFWRAPQIYFAVPRHTVVPTPLLV